MTTSSTGVPVCECLLKQTTGASPRLPPFICYEECHLWIIGIILSETSSLFASTPSWKSRETFIAIFTILMIAIHLLLRFGIQSQASTSNVPLIGVLVLSGIPLV